MHPGARLDARIMVQAVIAFNTTACKGAYSARLVLQ